MLQPARPPFFLASGGLVGHGCEGNGWFSARLCRLGPFRCRVSCPGSACKVEAARLLWNKVLQALLHLVVSCSGGGGGPVGLVGGGSEDLVGASVRGGPCTGVFRRPVMAAASSASGLLRFWQAAEVRGSWVQDVEKAAGLVEARRLGRARLPRGGGRRRRRSACIQGRRSLGRGPDRWAFSGSFCSSARTGVYCGPLQSRRAMELLSASRWVATAGADARRRRRRRLLESSASVGSKDQFAISFFFEVLCVSWAGQLSSVSFYSVSVFVRSLYAFLIP